MILTLEQEIVFSIFTVVAGSILVRIIAGIIFGIARKAGAKPGPLRSLRDVIIVVWILVILTTVSSIFGLASDYTTLTLSGIGGVAVSLALQSTLSNVISGFLLFHDKTIRLGDEVSFSGIKGEIVQIGMRSTWIRTADDAIVSIGNSNLSSGPLVNYTSMSRLPHLSKTAE